MNDVSTANSLVAGDLLDVRDAAQRFLDTSEAVPVGCRVRAVRRSDHRSVVLDVDVVGAEGPNTAGPGADGRAVVGGALGEPFVAIEWTEIGGDTDVRAFVTGPVFAVGYRRAPGAWDLDDAATPEAVKRAAVAACEALSRAPRLVTLRSTEPVAASSDTTVVFDAAGVQGWLAARLKVGAELVDGWRLTEVYPWRVDELALTFERPGAHWQPRLKLRRRGADAQPAAFRTSSLELSYSLAFGATTEPVGGVGPALSAAALGLIRVALDRGVVFVDPQRVTDALTDATGATPAAPQALNLAIPASCGQACTFCSVREEIYWDTSADDVFVTRLADDIRRAAGRGTRTLRINGIEPLNAPYLFDLLAIARDEAGFEEFTLHSTCRPLAKGDFARRFIQAMPARYSIYVPIYGASAEVHDAITGLPGTFGHVMQAVANLRELMAADDAPGEGTLIFTTVLSRANAHEMVALRDLVRPLGRWWEVHLPFPNTSSKTDKYREVSLPFSDALDAIYPKGWWPLADLPLGEIPPCVALTHQQRTGHELLTPARVAQRATDPAGTFYKSAGFDHSLGQTRTSAFMSAMTPCPHRDECALATVCPRAVYTLYAQQYGLDELVPATRAALAALPQGDGVLAAIDAA